MCGERGRRGAKRTRADRENGPHGQWHTFREVEADFAVEELVLPREALVPVLVAEERLEAVQRLLELGADAEQCGGLSRGPHVLGEDADPARDCEARKRW